ncbi:MAG TPA: hypothetical protein VE401_08390 [Solirubrobacterales bacterium]|nr:hypothetical protein [Solirubrobacterales bacterium]HZA90239.1 hypothetical protein [Solirubrobacterales bacterium]
MLDRARDQLGLPDVETVIVREKIEAGNRALRPGRDAEGKVIQMCPECGAVSSGPTGIPEPVADRKWWCASHKHLAGADDHLPPEDLDPVFDARTMSIRPNPAELERLRAEDERRAEEDRERNERRQAEAEAIKAARERYLEEADNLPDILGFHPRQVRHE